MDVNRPQYNTFSGVHFVASRSLSGAVRPAASHWYVVVSALSIIENQRDHANQRELPLERERK